MLLGLMRKHAKSWLIKFLIGIIAVVFIFYFGYSFTSTDGLKIAEVNGDPISGAEYQKAYKNLLTGLQRDYKSLWNEELIKVFDLKNRALQDLINQKLLSQEARAIGLSITDAEIQNQILSYPSFQFRGRFDESRYRSLLSQNRMKPEDYEAGIAQDLLQAKLNQFLTAFLPVTKNEVIDQYTFSNQKVKISFVKFLPESFKDLAKADEAPMGEYFEEHKAEYRMPEKIKINYIVIDPEKFADKGTVTDQQISEYYEENIETFKKKKEVKARHILLKLDQKAPKEEEEKVKEKALSLLKKARGGEDFAALAKEHSEGPSGKDGGDLGYFSSGQMVKPFEEAAFKLKKGEISEPVRTTFGYHLIKMDDIRGGTIKTLDQAHEEVKKNLSSIAASDLAYEKALSLIDQMPYDVDVVEYAAKNEVQVYRTDYFSRIDPIPQIGSDEKLKESIFALRKKDVSELLEFEGKFYIVQVVDKKASYLPKLDEVADEVKKAFKAHLVILEAEAKAKEYLEELKNGKDWHEIAKEHKLSPEETDFFTRNQPVPKIGYDPDLLEAAFALGEDRIYPDRVFKVRDGVFVVRWEGRKGIDEKKYQEEKDKFQFSLAQIKHQAIYGGWLGTLRKEARIEILQQID